MVLHTCASLCSLSWQGSEGQDMGPAVCLCLWGLRWRRASWWSSLSHSFCWGPLSGHHRTRLSSSCYLYPKYSSRNWLRSSRRHLSSHPPNYGFQTFSIVATFLDCRYNLQDSEDFRVFGQKREPSHQL